MCRSMTYMPLEAPGLQEAATPRRRAHENSSALDCGRKVRWTNNRGSIQPGLAQPWMLCHYLQPPERSRKGRAVTISVRIAVSDPLPVYRRGMLATLGEVGFEPETPDDLLTWVHHDHRGVILLTLQMPRDWSLMAALRRARADLLVIAVLTDPSTEAYVNAILAGATAAVPRDAPLSTIRRVFDEAIRGTILLPTEVVRALALTRQDEAVEPLVPTAQLEWLRALAQGVTVAQLAERNGYSERAMYRHLRDLYARMGVNTRTEALILANRRAWL
jgi:DNA-binding NarL/FixJ family response regulator